MFYVVIKNMDFFSFLRGLFLLCYENVILLLLLFSFCFSFFSSRLLSLLQNLDLWSSTSFLVALLHQTQEDGKVGNTHPTFFTFYHSKTTPSVKSPSLRKIIKLQTKYNTTQQLLIISYCNEIPYMAFSTRLIVCTGPTVLSTLIDLLSLDLSVY